MEDEEQSKWPRGERMAKGTGERRERKRGKGNRMGIRKCGGWELGKEGEKEEEGNWEKRTRGKEMRRVCRLELEKGKWVGRHTSWWLGGGERGGGGDGTRIKVT